MRIHVIDHEGKDVDLRSFVAQPGRTIVVELATTDMENIRNMNPEATLYSMADDGLGEAAHVQSLELIKARPDAYRREGDDDA